jgi:replicative DNA helicase
MFSHKDRIILETSIISELLSDPNAFIKVSDILSPVNFFEPKYQKIYEACVELYPNDIITIYVVSKKTGIELMDLLIESPIGNGIICNIRYNAIALLEESIKESFILLCKNLINENSDSFKKSVLVEILETAHTNKYDVFELLKQVTSFMTNKELFINEVDRFEGFNKKIMTRLDCIKKENKIKNLYYHLDNIYKFDNRKKNILKALSDLTRYVMAHEVTNDLEIKILSLSKI